MSPILLVYLSVSIMTGLAFIALVFMHMRLLRKYDRLKELDLVMTAYPLLKNVLSELDKMHQKRFDLPKKEEITTPLTVTVEQSPKNQKMGPNSTQANTSLQTITQEVQDVKNLLESAKSEPVMGNIATLEKSLAILKSLDLHLQDIKKTSH